jgi:soluble cytochrome b562
MFDLKKEHQAAMKKLQESAIELEKTTQDSLKHALEEENLNKKLEDNQKELNILAEKFKTALEENERQTKQGKLDNEKATSKRVQELENALEIERSKSDLERNLLNLEYTEAKAEMIMTKEEIRIFKLRNCKQFH